MMIRKQMLRVPAQVFLNSGTETYYICYITFRRFICMLMTSESLHRLQAKQSLKMSAIHNIDI